MRRTISFGACAVVLATALMLVRPAAAHPEGVPADAMVVPALAAQADAEDDEVEQQTDAVWTLLAWLDALEAIRQEEPLYEETFTRDRGDWVTGSSPYVGRSITDRAYRFDVKEAMQSAVSAAGIDAVEFLAEAAVEHIDVPHNSFAGLVFGHHDDSNYYAFLVNGEGEFALEQVLDGQALMIADWQPSEAIVAGEDAQNLLAVVVHRGQLLLLANDIPIWEGVLAEDGIEGDIGMMAGGTADEGIRVAFDDLVVWDLSDYDTLPSQFDEPAPDAAPFTWDPALLDVIYAQEPLLSESFLRERSEWVTFSAEAETFYQDRAYHIRLLEPDSTGWRDVETPLADFLAEVDVIRISGEPGAYASLLFRYQDDDHFYSLDIAGDGSFTLYKKADSEWYVLASGESTALDASQGAANRIGVLARGPDITVLANDEALATVVDEAYAEGDVALGAGTNSAPEVEIAFDDLEIWDLAPLAEQLSVIEPVQTAEAITITETATVAAQPTATPTPEVAPVTAQPTATPTPEAATTPAATGATASLAIVDDIRKREPNWSSSLAQDDGLVWVGEESWGNAGYRDDAYHVAVHGSRHFYDATADILVEDFYAEVDTELLHDEFAKGASYGIVFRYNPETAEAYLYSVSTLGDYSLARWTGPGQAEFLLDWTETGDMNMADVDRNRLGILAQGDKITLLLNDAVLAEVHDSAYKDGLVSLGAAKSLGGNDVDVAFRNLRVWDLKPSPLRMTAQPSMPASTLVPTPTPVHFPLDRVTISSPAFEACYVTTSYPTVEKRTAPVPGAGTAATSDALVASVAKISIDACRSFTATFYDAAGAPIGYPAPVFFDPEPLFPGSQVEAFIMLPEGWENAVQLVIQ